MKNYLKRVVSIHLLTMLFVFYFVSSQAQTWTGSVLELNHYTLGNNGDYTAIYRADAQSDRSVLRISMGDEYTSDFQIGYTRHQDGIWNTTFNLDGLGNGYYQGNLGIGEHAPQAKLTVLENSGLGTSIGNHKLLSRFSVTGNVNHFMINEWLYRDANGADWFTARAHNGISIDASFLTPGVDTRTWWERDPYNNIQSWGDVGQTYMTINQGNVGIGTTNPTQKLTVNGTVYSTEVKVDVNAGTGPDYVFEPTYQLPSLTDIENYIKANKHLPEVPSAKEMEANGINLSEMNMLLLKKVEELTLYVIKQNNTIDNLQQEKESTNSKIDQMLLQVLKLNQEIEKLKSTK